DRHAHECWQGGEESSNFNTATAHAVDDRSNFTAQIDHHEVRMRRNVAKPECVQFRAKILFDFAIKSAAASNLIHVFQTRERRHQRHDIHAVEYLMRSHTTNVSGLRDAITTAQAGHAVNLRKRARHDQVWIV